MSRKLTPILVAPQIYRFDFEETDEREKWGWQSVKELLMAVNNIRGLKNRPPLAVFQCQKILAQKLRHSNLFAGTGFTIEIVLASGDPCTYAVYENDNWLEFLQARECYIPAGLGRLLLNVA